MIAQNVKLNDIEAAKITYMKPNLKAFKPYWTLKAIESISILYL